MMHAFQGHGINLKFVGRLLIFIILTLLTEVGGLAYLVALMVGRNNSDWLRKVTAIVVGLSIYSAMTFIAVPPLAQLFGRTRLPCGTTGDGPVVAATSMTCFLNRGYVTPEMGQLLKDLGAAVSARFPGSKLTTLEGNFPFVRGFPLLPHLSHSDGNEADVAYFYRRSVDHTAILSGSPSWIGYFIYEQPQQNEEPACSGQITPLRWNFAWLQPEKKQWVIDEERTAWMLDWLKSRAAVRRIFVEPYLAKRLGAKGGKVHFQGCHAARHDDHTHIEVY